MNMIDWHVWDERKGEWPQAVDEINQEVDFRNRQYISKWAIIDF